MNTCQLRNFALAVLCSLLGACATSPADRQAIRVINWNVLYGFNHHKSPVQASEWLQTQKPNVVTFQELNGISEQDLREMAHSWGHDYAVTHKEQGFPVGLSSNRPIEVIERRVEGLHHGFLHCKTYDIHFFVVHFWPGKPYDVDQVLYRAKPLLEQNQKVIILGDFNGCSRRDQDFLEANATLRELDYTFVDMVERSGFHDLVFKHDPEAKVSFPSPITIPKWTKDLAELKQKEYRIDFIFADSKLAKYSTSATISLSKKVQSISDHYPVIAELQIPLQ